MTCVRQPGSTQYCSEAAEAHARISELEAAIVRAIRKADANGMGAWPAFVGLRNVMNNK